MRTTEGDKFIVVPDQIFNSLDSNKKSIDSLETSHNKYQKDVIKSFSDFAHESKNSFKKTFDFLTDIQKLADERAHEIQRFRDGYDYIKLQNFIGNLIRIIDELEDVLNKKNMDKDELCNTVKDMKDELLILLENNNIQQIRPEIGERYSVTSLDYKVMSRVSPEEPQEEETISQIIKPGYRLIISENKSKVIREAQIIINRKHSTTEEYKHE